ADLRVTPNAEDHDVHMTHTMLYLGQTYDGPTELGGLVLRPELRKHPEKLGRLLSLARFVFIARHRGWFRDRLLAELLPPLVKGPGGTTRSPLWDAQIGRASRREGAGAAVVAVTAASSTAES